MFLKFLKMNIIFIDFPFNDESSLKKENIEKMETE